ncbi:hypothetical protein COCSUDRAFT_53936 [Coccomyxa subellipsoidea C-169]|uniref:Uncharacterized protein n=1 Tax=Coccomyxa subellipsoidea (strain C-169) TaxID=574566 RepID=I0YUF0_COCSC|nr:hypothetical protein COCSUDRAFT_53936 [Coccomyxa subellipsoidea C-169]EIE22019.1 hypothetical protein COCSUDRAFT_53936 [Coccomyxa subellipsoidea C-169]|eukprot:XP_005646563.1 hypothetical protein COCSUDRAFT_53936 [Coccomyxa subellipsoidea C-169]
MDSFLKKAAEQVAAASDKAAQAAEAKIGASGAEQVKKYGHEAADKIAHINPADLEGQLKSYGVNIPGLGSSGTTNATTAGKAAVPTSANATTGGVVTKLAAAPEATPDAPAAAATPATEPAATPAAAVDPAAPATGTH